MTMVVAVLSPHYALVMADQAVTFPDINIKVGDVPVTIQRPSMNFQKLWPSDDHTSLLAVAGTIRFHGTYVDDVKNLGGINVDEAIAKKFVEHGQFSDFPNLPIGTYLPEESLHIYSSGGRFIICAQAVNKFRYERLYLKDSPMKVKQTVIGSGLSVVPHLLDNEEPFKSEWELLSQRTGMDAFEHVFRFWKRVYQTVSQRVPSVGASTISVRLTVDRPKWMGFNGSDWVSIQTV